jgi:hypothetical protein
MDAALPPGESLVFRCPVSLVEPVKAAPKLSCFVGFKVDFDTAARVSKLRQSGAHRCDSDVSRYALQIGLLTLERIVSGHVPETIAELCEWLEARNAKRVEESEGVCL